MDLTAARMAARSPLKRKRANLAGRKRKLEPNPRTPEGQCALYLRSLLDGKDYSEVAESIGVQRSTLFNYVAGTTTPSDSVRDRLAKALGYRDYRDLMPTDDFLKSIGQAAAKKRRS